MRKKITVKKVFQRQECTSEDVVKFTDLDGNNYLWYTKSTNTKISFIKDGSIINISADTKEVVENCTILKNVRLLNTK